MTDTLICRSCGNTGRMFTGKPCACRVGRAVQALATAMQSPPSDGERHDKWQYITILSRQKMRRRPVASMAARTPPPSCW